MSLNRFPPGESITTEELLRVLSLANVEYDNAVMRVSEIALAIGHSENWVRRKMKILLANGYIEIVPAIVVRMDGIRTTGHGYRLTEKGRKALENYG